jgi:hypothetical protein
LRLIDHVKLGVGQQRAAPVGAALDRVERWHQLHDHGLEPLEQVAVERGSFRGKDIQNDYLPSRQREPFGEHTHKARSQYLLRLALVALPRRPVGLHKHGPDNVTVDDRASLAGCRDEPANRVLA